jgi:predicted transcriptional regulator
VTGDRRKGAQQQDLFSEADAGLVPEPVLMGLHPAYYELIWRGLKRHEFRRRFVEGRPARWFVYLNAPVSRLSAVIDLGPAIADAPQRIAAIAEETRPRNGASVLEYVKDLERAFAIPILHVREYQCMSAAELRDRLGRR